MSRQLAIILGFTVILWGACGATCSRSEVRTEERRETYVLDAGSRSEATSNVALERTEEQIAGPVEVERVVEILTAPTDGGAPQVTRRERTTTKRAAVTSKAATKIAEQAHAEAASSIQIEAKKEAKSEAKLVAAQEVGLSWPVRLAILVGLIVLGYLVWRFRGVLL